MARVSATTHWAGASPSATTLFSWDGDTLAFESTQSTEAQNERAWRGDSVHYIYEPGSFVPLVQIRQARAVALSETTDVKALIAANGGIYDIAQDPLWNSEQGQAPAPFGKEEIAFYQCDHLGTPQELTDHEGRIAWSANYKAWGEAKQAISEAGRKAGFRNPIRFQGQYWDDETGLHYNRYRYYDPHSGRFVSSDPIKLLGGLNTFAYAKNSTNYIDPLGLATRQPTITAAEITDKTRSEIRALASSKGLTPTGQPDSTGLPRKWKCPCIGNKRLRLDRGHIDQQTGLPYNDPKAAVDHVHAYQPDGITKIVSPVDGNAHFPTKGP